MHDQPETVRSPEAVEHDLRAELARGDLSIGAVQPVLRHLLCNDEPALLNDAVIARVRGMVGDVARQLLEVQAETAGESDLPGFVAEHGEALADRLSGTGALLGHVHAIAVEGLLLERLGESGIDPVVPPVVVDLAAGNDGEAAGLAVQVLAAQARFVQHYQRMALPLGDLPAEVFYAAVLVHDDAASSQRLRSAYQEGAGRVALVTRLAMDLSRSADRGLAIEHVGGSVFASALALASGQPRDVVLASLATRSNGRVALALRAAGLSARAIEAQLALLQPRASVPVGIDALDSTRAGALLAAAPAGAAY